ncbi:MAG: SDR family oxidoreductase [Novosphingobium sp.]|nr:SDR family oxidoreductase [Novosphingobium sp.]
MPFAPDCLAGRVAFVTGAAGGIGRKIVKACRAAGAKIAAIEFAPFGIRVNSIHPAAVNTPMITGLGGSRPQGEGTLIGRIMEPEEVANMAVFLASDASSYSTGSEFVCDGGLRA